MSLTIDGRWEKLFARILDSSSIVKSFTYEPFPIPYKWAGSSYTYFPDFLVRFKDKTELVVELRGWLNRGYKEKNKFKAAEKFCKQHGMEFLVLVGSDFKNVVNSMEPVTALLQ
jgi:hypothetical protein